MSLAIKIICPKCSQDGAFVYAQREPDGWIGCFCKGCITGHKTKDPEEGWKEVMSTSYERMEYIISDLSSWPAYTFCDKMHVEFARMFGEKVAS